MQNYAIAAESRSTNELLAVVVGNDALSDAYTSITRDGINNSGYVDAAEVENSSLSDSINNRRRAHASQKGSVGDVKLGRADGRSRT